jgi:hypothetical protein
MSALRRSARLAAKANKPVAVCPPAPMKPSKKEHDAELLRNLVESSHWLFNEWDEYDVHDEIDLTYYIEAGRITLNYMANHIEEMMTLVRRRLPKNPEHWNKVLHELEYGTGYVIGAIRHYMPKTKDGIYIKNDADWILRTITGDDDARY